MHDYTQADWDPQTRALLDYAVKLTTTPSGVHHTDFQKLKNIGLSDRQILSTVLIACYFNFMTRIADGLGVEPAEGRQEAVEAWLVGPARDQEWLLTPKT